MKLGIFGDSFAFPSWVHGGWPNDLAYEMNISPKNYAIPGSSIWYSYKKFLENYTKFTHIVFAYSNPHRWPVLPEHLAHCHWVTDKVTLRMSRHMDDDQKKEMEKLIDVHPYIFDMDFNIFMFQSVFKSLNSVCKSNNIKLVNLITCEDDFKKLGDQTDSSVIYGLHEISREELKQKNKLTKLQYIENVIDVRGCHMNKTNNKVLANIISHELNSNSNSVINLYKDTRLNFDPSELVDMIEEYDVRCG